MRIVAELVGGIVLLLIFAWGVNETIKFFTTNNKETRDDDVQPAERTPDAAAPRAGDKEPH